MYICVVKLLMHMTKASYYYVHPYDMIGDTRPARSITRHDPTITPAIVAIVFS
jgi:hypothetical protein